MSEPIHGIEFSIPKHPPRTAAAVILVREGSRREVFWVRRGKNVSFSRGYHAFPGGAVDPADAEIAIHGADGPEAQRRVSALRELYEETGVLLAPGAQDIDQETIDHQRRNLLDGAPFNQILEQLGVHLDANVLVPAGRWLTPPISPIRFDTFFYMAVVSSDVVATVIPGELAGGEWIEPAAALARWQAGTALLHPPNRHALSVLAGVGPEDAAVALCNPPHIGTDFVPKRIRFQRGILVHPMRTPTLPPAEHTHCYLVGTGDYVLIDPGSPWEDEQQHLIELMNELADEGRRPQRIVLTHHHADHIGAARAIADRFNIKIAAHPTTAEKLGIVDEHLTDGDVIEIAGPMPMRLHVLTTEGHADGHLCFQDEGSGAVFVGDLLAGGSTIVLDPPEGKLALYLQSLERLEGREPTTLYPAHGHAIPDGPKEIARYIAHRIARMEALAEAVLEGVTDLQDLVAKVYADTPIPLHPVAERSALASLIELEQRGIIAKENERWIPTN